MGRYSALPAVPPIAAAISAAATAATAAAATAAAAATTAATTAAATGTAAAATAAATLRAFFSFVHAKRTTVDHLPVHAFDGALSLLVRAHGHECEAARLAGGAIRDDVDVRHFSELRERGANGLGIRMK